MTAVLEHPPRSTVRDPVCGMEIAPADAVATRVAGGATHYLCSEGCLEAFDAQPERYATPVAIAAGSQVAARVALNVADLQRSGGPALERALAVVPSVVRARANVQEGRLFVDYDPARATVADLLNAIRAAGFTPDGQALRLKLGGLYCAEGVARIEDALEYYSCSYDQALRAESAACSEMVVFPDFNKSAALPEGETIPIELLPDRPGEFEFHCQMGMLRGKLVVE